MGTLESKNIGFEILCCSSFGTNDKKIIMDMEAKQNFIDSKNNDEYKDISSKNDDINLELKNIVTKSLKNWKDIHFEDIGIEPIKQALSSKLYIITDNNTDNKVVIRFYKPDLDLSLNKHQEIQKIFCEELKYGPKILNFLENGQIESYMIGRQLDRIKDLNDPKIYKNIARMIANVHGYDVNKNIINKEDHNAFNLWMQSIIDKSKKKVKTNDDNQFDWLISFMKDKGYDNVSNFIDSEWKWILKALKDSNKEICYYVGNNEDNNIPFMNSNDMVFIHGDPNPRNWFLMQNEDGISELKLIDYEFTCFSYRIWDFGFYFCEMAIDATNPPKFSLNFDTEFPSIKYQNEFIKEYLTESLNIYLKQNNSNKISVKPSDTLNISSKSINDFRSSVNIGIIWVDFLVSIFFGIYFYNNGPEWFKEYFKQRINVYFKHKKNL